MFIRISWGRIQPGKWDEYERRFDKLVATQTEAGGPKRRLLVRDLDEPDAGFAISIFETEQEMRAWGVDPAARERVQAEMADIYIGDYRIRQCEVRREIG
jgi:heme-degrading monooxygenase HmoA